MTHEHARKGFGKGKDKKGGAVFSEEDRGEFLPFSLTCNMLLNEFSFFKKNLIQNTGIGCS